MVRLTKAAKGEAKLVDKWDGCDAPHLHTGQVRGGGSWFVGRGPGLTVEYRGSRCAAEPGSLAVSGGGINTSDDGAPECL